MTLEELDKRSLQSQALNNQILKLKKEKERLPQGLVKGAELCLNPYF